MQTCEKTYRWSPWVHFLVLQKIFFKEKWLLQWLQFKEFLPHVYIKTAITLLWKLLETRKWARSQVLRPFWTIHFSKKDYYIDCNQIISPSCLYLNCHNFIMKIIRDTKMSKKSGFETFLNSNIFQTLWTSLYLIGDKINSNIFFYLWLNLTLSLIIWKC